MESTPLTVKKVTLIAILACMLVTIVTKDASRLDAAGRHPRKKSAGRASSSIQQKRASTEKALAKLQQEIAKYESELRERKRKKEKHSKASGLRKTRSKFENGYCTARTRNVISWTKIRSGSICVATNNLLESRKSLYEEQPSTLSAGRAHSNRRTGSIPCYWFAVGSHSHVLLHACDFTRTCYG